MCCMFDFKVGTLITLKVSVARAPTKRELRAGVALLQCVQAGLQLFMIKHDQLPDLHYLSEQHSGWEERGAQYFVDQ